MKVLIVEDDHVLSLMLQKMISEMGYIVIDAVSKGASAIESALQQECDLILMDIMLDDEIDGIEAYREIRRVKNVPVIYITGNSDPMNVNRAEQVGFYDFLAKPVIFEELKDTIRSLAQKTN
jgi:DNA-binding response OmpR family regulator